MSADGAAPAPAAGRRDDGGKRPRLGLRDELLFLVPAAVLLLVVLSTFTLFSYRSALLRLRDERQQEAARLARGVADRLLAAGPAGGAAVPSPDRLRLLAPGARAVALLDARGMALAAAGELQPLQLPEAGPAAGPGATPRLRPFATGPDADLPDAVAGFAPLLVRLAGSAPAGASAAPGPAASGAPAAVLYVRLDLDAATLGAQLRAIRLLCWLVLPVNSALVVLVLLLLRRLLTPYETLLARARQLGQPAAAGEDEAEFLIATLERALEALGEQQRALAGAYQEGQEGQEGRRADDDLAAIERTLAASLESGLLLLGRDGRVLSLNALGAALLGAAPPAAGAPPPLAGELLAPHPELLALIDAAIALGRPVNRQECTLRGPAGEALTLGLSVHPLRRDDGAARGYLVLFADLTEARRRAEESRLNDRLATLGEMAAGVAHELRNSLATLRGYLTLIERRPDEESIADFLAEIRRESDHLQRVLEDFLAFARPGTARLQHFSMQALAHRAAGDPALAGVEVEVRAAGRQAAARAPGAEPPAEAPLLGDPQLIERALRNVLHNAAQAELEAGRRGPVEVTVDDQPAGVEVTIADRGPGVPAEMRDRLFHPFATGRAGGVGLGLALAHRIVTLHGGRIRLEDRPHGGTLARLTFPRDTFVTESSAAPLGAVAADFETLDPSH
jgi:signal transduction histidine kinase